MHDAGSCRRRRSRRALAGPGQDRVWHPFRRRHRRAGRALMALVRGTTIVDDPWRTLDADKVLPADEPVIVGKARFLAERDALAGRNAPLGILIEAGEGLAGLT